MSACGTSRHFATAQQFGRIWSEADINLSTTGGHFRVVTDAYPAWPACRRHCFRAGATDPQAPSADSAQGEPPRPPGAEFNR
jgi:hypothetical protein